MGYDKTFIFTRLGKAVKKYNTVAALPDGFAPALDRLLEETVDVFNDTPADRRLLDLFSSANRGDQSSVDSMKRQAVSIASSFITNDLAERLGAVGSTASAALARLRDEMQENSDAVLESLPAATSPVYDNDNTGNGSMSAVTVDQMTRDANHFECECIDDSTPGGEKWRVTSSRLGYVGEAVTDEEFDASEENADGNVEAGVKFTISAATGSGAEDWAVGDRIRFSTYVTPYFTESGDALDEVENWTFYNVLPGVNTSVDKKLYFELSSAGSPTTYTLSVYRDASKTDLAAEGSTTDYQGTIEFSEKNGSGLSGKVDLDYGGDFDDVVVTFTSRALFQEFLVERFSRAMPSAESGSETVSETLAG